MQVLGLPHRWKGIQTFGSQKKYAGMEAFGFTLVDVSDMYMSLQIWNVNQWQFDVTS